MNDIKSLPGLKRHEIGKSVTGKGVASDGPLFYRVTIETCVLDPLAIQRQAGLEMMMGNAAIAAAMGPDEHLAKVIDRKVALFTLTEATELSVAVALEA
jgi:hypothetical protein